VGDTIIIAAGFNGPRLSGNGGYVGGLMAGRFTEKFGGDGAVDEHSLEAPPVEMPSVSVRREDEWHVVDSLATPRRAIAGRWQMIVG